MAASGTTPSSATPSTATGLPATGWRKSLVNYENLLISKFSVGRNQLIINQVTTLIPPILRGIKPINSLIINLLRTTASIHNPPFVHQKALSCTKRPKTYLLYTSNLSGVRNSCSTAPTCARRPKTRDVRSNLPPFSLPTSHSLGRQEHSKKKPLQERLKPYRKVWRGIV